MSKSTQKRILAAALMAAILAGSGVSSSAAPRDAQAQAGSSAPASQAMQATFEKNMQTMRAQMMQLRDTRDPAARTRLLNAHMHSMQDTLHMMMGPGSMGRGSGMGPGMMNGGSGMGPGMMHGDRMAGSGGMMSNGQMMQMMMGQMMQHQQAMQGMGCTR